MYNNMCGLVFFVYLKVTFIFDLDETFMYFFNFRDGKCNNMISLHKFFLLDIVPLEESG